MQPMHVWIAGLLDIIFPVSDRVRRVASLRAEPLPYAPSEREINRRSITRLSSYDEPRVRDAICALKFERDRHALELLSGMLNDFFVEYCADEALFGRRTICVPVPLGKKRLAERGLNQTEAILRETDIVRSGSLSLVHALVRTRETAMQSTLKREARFSNVRGAFGLAPRIDPAALCNATVLLIDDVTTTGATLSEAARPLEQSGAKVHCIAIAG